MSNPGNAVGTNAAYGGRTSVNAFNDDLSAWSRGVMSGWACTPDGGLVVSLGGNGTDRDVAVAEDNVGNKTSINNISGAPIKLTMTAAPGSGTRLDSIVAYVDASPQGEATIVDNYGACGLIVVQGTPSASPVAPTDNEIRSAITSDGASGPTAYYVVLATITMASGTTDVTAGEIAAGDAAGLVGEGIVTADNIDCATYSTSQEMACGTWVDGKTIYKKTIDLGTLPNNSTKNVQYNISNFSRLVKLEGSAYRSTDGANFPLPFASNSGVNVIAISIDTSVTSITVVTNTDRSNMTGYITMYYTKTS